MRGKLLKKIAIGTLLIAAGVLGWHFFKTSERCRDTATFGAISPDNRHAAIVYQHNCSSVKSTTTNVMIQTGVSTFKGGGKDSVVIVDQAVAIGVFWTDNSNLLVQCIDCLPGNIVHQETTWRDLTISYEFYGK